MILRKEVRMLLDEGDDVIHFLLLCVETAFPLLCHNELVSTDASAFVVQTDIRRIAQTVPAVQVVSRINQYVLYVQSLQEVVVGKVSVSHRFIFLFSFR